VEIMRIQEVACDVSLVDMVVIEVLIVAVGG
jgi:hypothetical protein